LINVLGLDMQSPISPGVILLTDREIPKLVPEQLVKFDAANIHVEPVMPFEPAAAAVQIQAIEGQQILAGDFGGDKGIVRLFKIIDGRPIVEEGYASDTQGDNGTGYLATMEQAAAYAVARGIPFGISWGGPMIGTKPQFHPKATSFLKELDEQHGGDIAAISPSIICINDGPAGAISGGFEAFRQYQSSNLLFVINGGGVNTSVIKDGQLYSNESGHVEALAALNSYHQTTACGVFGATYTCVERVGANKAGIEAQWQDKTGEYMRARDIEDQYKVGDTFAGDLYEHSAWVVAHLILGSAYGQGLDLTDPSTAIVAHGGGFKFPHYGERVAQILGAHLGSTPRLLMTKDYVLDGSNACLDGAAIAAAYQG
jgi:hypothetical protein